MFPEVRQFYLKAVDNQYLQMLFRLLQYSLFEESLTDFNEMNDDALFDYPWFDAYFIEPQREAYFIRGMDTQKLLGFVMVRRHMKTADTASQNSW